MGKHSSPASALPQRALAAGVVLVLIVAAAAVLWRVNQDRASGSTSASAATAGATGGPTSDCQRRLNVVTATSFAPVLRRVAGRLADGPDCLALTVTQSDGQAAAATMASTGADLWIPDDGSWAKLPNTAKLATGGLAGTVLASSPLYFVTRADAAPLPDSAKSWLGLDELLVQAGSSWHLALTDPAASGDAMTAAGGLTEAMIGSQGTLVAALDLLRIWQASNPLTGIGFAPPTQPNQVTMMTESALIASGHAKDYTIVAPTDTTRLLRYAWYPSAVAMANPTTEGALTRLHQVLAGPDGAADLDAAGLRGPIWPAPAPKAAADLPPVTAAAAPAVSEHHMYHVLATWNPALRQSNMLVVVDVSGSMKEAAPGTTTPKIALVRSGIDQVVQLLPDSAQLGLWEFGSLLDPPNDWRSLVDPAPLAADQRQRLAGAEKNLQARNTGTGLYDTILGAYRYQQAHYQSSMPNVLVLITDGVNQDDPDSITLDQLNAGLAATDPNKRVQLSVFGIGNQLPVAALNSALAPVGGQVDQVQTPDQVIGALVHAVSGALSGVPR